MVIFKGFEKVKQNRVMLNIKNICVYEIKKKTDMKELLVHFSCVRLMIARKICSNFFFFTIMFTFQTFS